MRENTLTVEPSLEWVRRLKEEPSEQYPRMEQLSARRTTFRTETEEPTSAQARRDIVEPIVILPKIEIVLPRAP
jgi:hypothetical protein